MRIKSFLVFGLPLLLLISPNIIGQTDYIGSNFHSPAHPRILLFKGEEAIIKKTIASDPVWTKLQQALLSEADNLISAPLLQRIQIGRRLLDKSREALRRIFFLSYAYRTTGDQKYLQRAEKEMLDIAGFSDWNPSHFLDVAEMTMAIAIGYDWLYDDLPAVSKTTIKEAILKKGT